ncbi:hypothetical protein [Actinomadura rugatobispora]|uniref:Lantibiotic n=1 Tax=Actinomadura rugatobispora TaxID=1994 RepID=A0ABW0ZS81_9ACTN|nr:hypothetical protein GCM10010200_035560 [Actinomadura rugatobispora]
MTTEAITLAPDDEDLFDLDIRVSAILDQHTPSAGPTGLYSCCNVNGSSCTCPITMWSDNQPVPGCC